MMKKKPPPGATLIARLKERRLQRDGLEQPLTGENTAEYLVDVEATDDIVSVEIAPADIAQLPVLKPAASLIQKAISIEDLRPFSEDYMVLTEEIRLAGRFAAVGIIAQGLRLALMHQAEIHKEHYGSFEEYCRREHRMSATYAYRLIRMAEMAEKMAERSAELGKDKDPFENMLYLGHRHLMALLPLPGDQAEELLLEGIPAPSGEGRIPIGRATEKQIKAALGRVDNKLKRSAQAGSMDKELLKLVSAMESYAQALEEGVLSMPPKQNGEFKQLLGRFKAATDRVASNLRSREF